MVRDTELSNLAMAAAADRAMVSNLTTTISQLAEELTATNVPLVAGLANDTTLVASIDRGRDGGRRCGRGGDRGGDIPDPLFMARVGGPTGKYYCWSCGDFCYHSSPRCRNKKAGHKDEATSANKMNGSTHSFAAVPAG